LRPYMAVYRKFGKRILDVVFALLLLLPAGIIMGVLAVLIRMESPGPVLFRQKRPGMDGKVFEIYKLRSMLVERSYYGKPLTDTERITRIGRFMRARNLDELPQLINILRGEMSFIGPRPLVEQYIELYTPRQQRRHEVRPGMFGWAQVNARSDMSLEEKLEFDVYYVENMSLALDMKIISMNFRRRGTA